MNTHHEKIEASICATNMDNMDSLVVYAHGPLRFLTHPSIINDPSASTCGIYFWTIPYKGGELIYYVGETGTSFSKRMLEHLMQYLSGFYRIFDPTKFYQGLKLILWRGMYMEEPKPDIIEFINQHEQYMPALRGMLNLFNIWILPIDCDKRIRRRIEGAIASHLYSQPELIGQFQDSGIRYTKRKTGEKPICVKINAPKSIMGLPVSLDV